MRSLLILPLLALATPALAQVVPYPPAPYPAPYPPAPYGYAPPGAGMIPPQVFDPAMPAQLGRIAGALTHAFMYLCVNAVDAMSECGTLTLRTRNVDNDWCDGCVPMGAHGNSPAEWKSVGRRRFY